MKFVTVRAPGLELQKQEGTEEREGSRKQIRSVEELGDAVQSKGSEEVRNSEGHSEVLWIWERGTQEVGVSQEERKQKGRSGTTKRSMGEGERAQQSEGTAPKGSSNEHGGMDNKERSGNLCGVSQM